MTTNYDITQLADYVRGLTDPQTEQQIESYLQSSRVSSSTKKELSALRRVAKVAEIDRNLRIPENAVRCAKALGSIRRPEVRKLSLLERLTMALTFDSQTAPALAGTRDMRSTDRQMAFQSRGFQVDLRLETDKKGSVVVGQLVREGEEVEPVADIPVLAVVKDQVVARSKTGAMGEFLTERLTARPIDLLFLVDDDQCLEISLRELH